MLQFIWRDYVEIHSLFIFKLVYAHEKFKSYFDEHADISKNGIFPTVTIRQIMWAFKMKPLPKEKWETVFDRRDIQFAQILGLFSFRVNNMLLNEKEDLYHETII